jgi:hypothetical protein
LNVLDFVGQLVVESSVDELLEGLSAGGGDEFGGVVGMGQDAVGESELVGDGVDEVMRRCRRGGR